MKIKIRNTQAKGRQGANEQAQLPPRSPRRTLLPRAVVRSLGRIACRYLVMSKWSYENVSFVFQVQMSSTDTKQQAKPSTRPSIPPSHRPSSLPCFLLFVCSLAIFMPLLCLLFAFVSANAFKTLRLFSL